MIHPKAIIDKEAILGQGVKVGAYALIEKGVELGRGVVVSPYVHLKGSTYIGDDTFIGSGAVIGEIPQVMGLGDSTGRVYIGKNNVIREYVTINSSTSSDKVTSLGNNNFLMAFSHIAHDCKLANNVVICNGVLLAGHVEAEDNVFISGNTAIHQFVRIGRLAMLGGFSRLNRDVPPFMMVMGNSRVWGINLVGLRRNGFNKEDINKIGKAYRFLYRKGISLKNALAKLEEIDSDKVKEMIAFVLSSKRGICGPKNSTFLEKLFLDYPYFLRTTIPAYRRFAKCKVQRGIVRK